MRARVRKNLAAIAFGLLVLVPVLVFVFMLELYERQECSGPDFAGECDLGALFAWAYAGIAFVVGVCVFGALALWSTIRRKRTVDVS